jgi:hypothetical protein
MRYWDCWKAVWFGSLNSIIVWLWCIFPGVIGTFSSDRTSQVICPLATLFFFFALPAVVMWRCRLDEELEREGKLTPEDVKRMEEKLGRREENDNTK